MKTLPLLLLLPASLQLAHVHCTSIAKQAPDALAIPTTDSLLYLRFSPPAGYARVRVDSSSFTHYLRHLPLKPPGSPVLYYNGGEKTNAGVYDAVVNLPIGSKNLHQCADAVIRLRAEYLWRQGKYDQISFRFTNGFPVDYAHWRRGGRVKVFLNEASWEESAAPSNSYDTFWAYLEKVFQYAGTLSLSKELKPVPLQDISPGDVFIQGGSPGHAVIVVDVAQNDRGQKVFLLAQSYMPAQEIQILKNPKDPGLSPWYAADVGETLETPEWTFRGADLKRW
jgi:hypothetical protein